MKFAYVFLLACAFLFISARSASAQAVTWTHVDYGPVPIPGTFTYTPGTPPTFTVQGSGSGGSGGGSLVYTTAAGNAEFETRLVSQSTTSYWAFAGISMGASLDASQPSVSLGAQPGPGLFMYTPSGSIAGPAIYAPVWLRLARNGNTISGYYSADGINWTLLGTYTATNVMPNLYYVTFAVNNTGVDALNTAVYDHETYSTSLPQIGSNIALWLRSDVGVTSNSGSVSNWADQSGGGNNATQISSSLQPTLTTGAINSGVLPTITFNGTSQYLNLPSGMQSLSNGASVFVMTQPSSATATSDLCAFGNASNSDAFRVQQAALQAKLFAYNGTTSSSVATTTSPLSTSGYQLLEEIYQPGLSAGTATGTIFVNGTQQAQSTSLQNLNLIARTKSTIGAGIGPASYFGGGIAEILVYDSVLTASQRKSVESYFLSKYGVGTQPTLDAAVLTPGPGIWPATQTVSISQDQNATTFYTTDGSTPSPASPFFNGTPLTVSSNETINTLAVAPFFNNASSSGLYQIDSTTSAVPRTGLNLWLRADNSITYNGSNQVSQWTDVSGSQNNATQSVTANQPIFAASAINSLPAVTFNGSSAYLQLNQILADFSTGASVIAVVKPTAVAANATIVDFENCAPGTYLSLKEPSSTASALNLFNSNWNSTVNSTNSVVVGSFQIHEAIFPPPIAASYTNTILNSNAGLAAGNNYIGRASAGSNYFNGQLAELYVYNAPLSSANRTALEGYLSTKYAITLANSNRNPHKFLTLRALPIRKQFPLLSAFNL